jgi:hypothetical protein
MGRLASYVHVADERGVMHVFGPDDEVPAWAAERITNPSAWAEDPADGGEAPNADAPPPRHGKGSGREAWSAFAAGHGVQVENDASRDDIIAALEAAGVVEAE